MTVESPDKVCLMPDNPVLQGVDMARDQEVSELEAGASVTGEIDVPQVYSSPQGSAQGSSQWKSNENCPTVQ